MGTSTTDITASKWTMFLDYDSYNLILCGNSSKSKTISEPPATDLQVTSEPCELVYMHVKKCRLYFPGGQSLLRGQGGNSP